jgi:hypothetical protein
MTLTRPRICGVFSFGPRISDPGNERIDARRKAPLRLLDAELRLLASRLHLLNGAEHLRERVDDGGVIHDQRLQDFFQLALNVGELIEAHHQVVIHLDSSNSSCPAGAGVDASPRLGKRRHAAIPTAGPCKVHEGVNAPAAASSLQT